MKSVNARDERDGETVACTRAGENVMETLSQRIFIAHINSMSILSMSNAKFPSCSQH